MNHSEMRKFLYSLFLKVQIWVLEVKNFFLPVLVNILALGSGSGSRKPNSCGSGALTSMISL